MKRFTILMLFTMLPALANGATYYVNKAGSNNNSCSTAQSPTPSNARLTITAGAACLSRGDTLIIHAGTYTEAVDNVLPSGISDTQRTIMRAATGETVILDGLIPPGGPGGAPNQIFAIRGRSYITVGGAPGEGIIFDGSKNGTGVGSGTGVNVAGQGEDGSASTYINFTYNTVRFVRSGDCISFYHPIGGPDGYGHHVDHNTIHDCGTVWPYAAGTQFNCSGHGFYAGSKDTTASYNEFYNIGDQTGPDYSIGCYGIHSFGTVADKSNNQYIGNYIHDVANGGILLNGRGDNQLSANNLIVRAEQHNDGGGAIALGDSGRGFVSYNETIVDSGGMGYYIANGATSPVVRNAIIWNTAGGAFGNNPGVLTQDHNLCSSGCAVTSNPQFMDAAGDNYRLTPGSPAIDRGVAISSVTADYDGVPRLQGSPYDIGAFEYHGGQLAPPKNLRVLVSQ